jgi:hypothetical protein
VDTTKPTVTLNGASTITLEQGQTYNEQGATVKDNFNQNLTAQITGSINTNNVGTYTITYNATDSSGNQATPVTRSVVVVAREVVDTIAPVISLNGSSSVNHSVGTNYSDPGATAQDNKDASVSVNVTGSVNTSVIGTYTIRYRATDQAGNASEIIRYVNVVDTVAPVITLNGSSTISLEVGSTYSELGANVSDNYASNLSVMITGSVNTNLLGAYTITYSASDPSGNNAISKTRTVRIVDTTNPVISLNGPSTVTLEVGTTYSEQGASVSDNYARNLNAVITGTVNNKLLGTYTITYSASDPSGNIATTKTRTVRIIDTTKPVITLNGEAVITIIEGSVFSDPGVTISDNYSNNIQPSVSGSVNSNTPGTYTVTYTALDESLNQSTISRTVIVSPKTTYSEDFVGYSNSGIFIIYDYEDEEWILKDYYIQNDVIYLLEMSTSYSSQNSRNRTYKLSAYNLPSLLELLENIFDIYEIPTSSLLNVTTFELEFSGAPTCIFCDNSNNRMPRNRMEMTENGVILQTTIDSSSFRTDIHYIHSPFTDEQRISLVETIHFPGGNRPSPYIWLSDTYMLLEYREDFYYTYSVYALVNNEFIREDYFRKIDPIGFRVLTHGDKALLYQNNTYRIVDNFDIELFIDNPLSTTTIDNNINSPLRSSKRIRVVEDKYIFINGFTRGSLPAVSYEYLYVLKPLANEPSELSFFGEFYKLDYYDQIWIDNEGNLMLRNRDEDKWYRSNLSNPNQVFEIIGMYGRYNHSIESNYLDKNLDYNVDEQQMYIHIIDFIR